MTYIMSQYDTALNNIFENGFDIEGDRTGVGTRCLFGVNTEYDISEQVPILSYRKVAYKSIIRETLWYISGSHSISELEAQGCGIWTPWKNPAFTQKHGLPEGSGGYIYGFNLIHFGADIKQFENRKAFSEHHANTLSDQFLDDIWKNAKGFNQLDYVINTLKANPKSRQACFTFWRPDTNHMAVLPACHAFYSFIVSPDEKGEMNILNCHLFQRSADYPIGVGMGNLWTATLFVYMIAQQLGMKPGKLYHSAAHAHIYHNAFDATKEYLERANNMVAHESPRLILNHKPSIYDYTVDDFNVVDYDAYPSIKFPIAV